MRIIRNRFAIMYSGLNLKANGFRDTIQRMKRNEHIFLFNFTQIFLGIFHFPYIFITCALCRTHFLVNFIFMIWKYHFMYAALFYCHRSKNQQPPKEKRKQKRQPNTRNKECHVVALKIVHRSNVYGKCAEKDCPQWK